MVNLKQQTKLETDDVEIHIKTFLPFFLTGNRRRKLLFSEIYTKVNSKMGNRRNKTSIKKTS